MKAPAGGLISPFSHKVHSFFGKLYTSATSHNTYTFKQTESYRCFNDLIGQESFEEIAGSIPGRDDKPWRAKVVCPQVSLPRLV